MGAIRIWTKGEEKYLIENYATKPYQEIADVLNRSELAVRLRRISLNLPPKLPRLPVNEHYFDAIDSDLKAYLLGFIAADGYVGKHSGSNSSCLTFGLNPKDRAVVERLRDKLAPEKNLYETEKLVRIDIRLSSHFLNVLADTYGITIRRKPLYVIPTSIPEQFIITFLLGYYDGDGSLNRTRRGHFVWTFCGGLPLVTQVSDLIHDALGFSIKPRPHSRTQWLNYLWLYSLEKIKKVDSWLHQSGLGLERKSFPNYHR